MQRPLAQQLLAMMGRNRASAWPTVSSSQPWRASTEDAQPAGAHCQSSGLSATVASSRSLLQLTSLAEFNHAEPHSLQGIVWLQAPHSQITQQSGHITGPGRHHRDIDIWQHIQLPALAMHPAKVDSTSQQQQQHTSARPTEPVPHMQVSSSSMQQACTPELHLWPGLVQVPVTQGPLPSPCTDHQLPSPGAGLDQLPLSAPGMGDSGEILQAGNRGTSYQPNKRKRLKKHGMVKRLGSPLGRATIMRRIRKGRWRLTVDHYTGTETSSLF
mmetsp:Transcript_8467/g.14528  ORF Transcript_8467/g.14528 Transcript_8467/m.14528 type:complete len:271 (+) Transcript_8467:23-835(+)